MTWTAILQCLTVLYFPVCRPFRASQSHASRSTRSPVVVMPLARIGLLCSRILLHRYSPLMSSSTPVGVPAPRMVEVERKVRWRVGRTEELLAQHGFVNAAKTVTFVDTYLDDEECTLTARDTWLRRRDAQWELKRPMARHAAAAAAGNPNLSRYEELTEEDDIVQAVEDIFSQRKDGGTESSDWNGVTSEMRRTPVAEMRLTESDLISTRLAALIASRSLFPVVHFRTTRRTLRHASNTEAGTVDKPDSTHEYSSLTVVLDEADYLRGGSEDTSLFRVAEVEIVLDSPTSNAVSEAERDVSDFARLLEEGDDSAASDSLLPRGKVERFLALHRPWHLELLRAARQRSASAAKADV